MHLESTNACSHNSFLFFVLTFVYTFNSLALLFCQFGITYQFWELLCTKVCFIVPTPNLQQNLSFCHCLLHLSLLDFSWSSSFVLTCNPLPGVLLCCICNISSSLYPSWIFCISLLSVHICCNWNTLVFHLYQNYLKTFQYPWVPLVLQMSFLFLFIVMSTFCGFISCPTEVITIFHSLSVSGATISRYPSMVLMMSAWTFFFSKNIMCMSLVSAFIANVSNLIIKLAMCFLPYWNVSIFHSVSAALLLLLKAILISLTNSSKSWCQDWRKWT